MKSYPTQQQTPNVDDRGYAVQQPPDDSGEKGADPQSGYQQYGFPPGQPYPPSYQGWRPYGYQRPFYTPEPGDISPFERTSMGMRARTAGLLCYLFGWVGGLVFLLLERENRFVRFHAIQSILFFGTLSIFEWVFGSFPFAFWGVSSALGLVGFIGWIVLMVAAHRGRYYKLPVFGYYAERLASQMRL